MKEQQKQSQSIYKNLYLKPSVVGIGDSFSTAGLQQSQNIHQISLNSQGKNSMQPQIDYKKYYSKETNNFRSLGRGKQVSSQNNKSEEQIILPQIKGSSFQNKFEDIQVNAQIKSKSINGQTKLNNDLNCPAQQQIYKQSEQYSNIYKQKVMKQNQLIKKRLYENASQIQSNYVPFTTKMQEIQVQQNSLSLQINGTLNQQKQKALQENFKAQFMSPQIAKKNSEIQQRQQIENQLNNNNHSVLVVSSQNALNANSFKQSNQKLNNKTFSRSSNQNKEKQGQNLSLNNISNSVIQVKKVDSNKSNCDSERNHSNQIQNISVKQEKDQIQVRSQTECTIDQDIDDITIQKGSQKLMVNLSKNSQTKGVKFGVDNLSKDSNKISSFCGVEEKGSKKQIEEIQSILKNKKQESISLSSTEIQQTQKTQSTVQDILNLEVNQVLSRKPTQPMESSTFSKVKSSYEQNSLNKCFSEFDEGISDENEDSFEMEERLNEFNDEMNQQQAGQKKEDQDQDEAGIDQYQENSPQLTYNEPQIIEKVQNFKNQLSQEDIQDNQNGNEGNHNNENEGDDDGATISYKKQVQQQIIEKQKNKGILKTFTVQETKRLLKLQKNTSNYVQRLQYIKTYYNVQEKKIMVQNTQNQQQFIIDIFQDDTGGGRYDWKINDVMLGAGSQGRVYKAFCQKQVRNFALKMINLDDFESDQALDVINEICLLKFLRGHQPFIQLQDVFGLERTNQKTLILVMDYCQCNLMEIINYRKDNRLYWKEEELMFIFKQMLEGLKLLQDKRICHRDLKMQNILFSAKDIKYKIGDFSEGKFLQNSQQEQSKEDQMLHSFRGTWKYLSPELSTALKNVEDVCAYDPYLSDLYSLGVLFTDLVSLNEVKFQTKVVNGNKSKNNSNYMTQMQAYLTACIQKNTYPKVCQLILSLLNESPENRKSFESILKSYELEIDLSQVILQQDKDISLEIENQRENSKVMSQYQKAKKLFIIAEGYEKILKFERAIEAYQQVLQATIYMNTKTIRSRALYNVGRCYEKLGQFIKSLEFYQQCYYFRKKIYKPDSRRIGEILNALGIAYNKLGNQQESKNYYEQSLQIALNIYGQNHIIIANMYNNLGTVYFSLKQYSKSSQNFEQAISILKAINLEFQSFEILNNLSMVYLEQGKFTQSELCLKTALDLVIKHEGEDNYRLISIYINLGTLLSEQRRSEEQDQEIKDRQLKSINYYQIAESLCIKYYGEQYHQLGEIYNLMGISYQNLQDFDRSLYYLLKSEDVLKNSNNQNILWQTYSTLGVLYNMQKLYEKSIEYFKKSLEIHDQIDSDLFKKADLCYNIGCIYLYSKKIADSKYWFEKSLNLYEQSDESHINIAVINKFLKKIQLKEIDES
ncbi:tetratricopeptide repeat protein (macronuclear) [Tetrahymena thermophila SB210]|uniref:Tetratricopeptide repeat protein n=1 Tax=Tetrahymena thermophila (strain SB210) TaxID=312017 RepID=I7MLJ9_TETTS|nr:tetratricopeptide repeat protein [Tetrahymena thermophila SB210]EAS02435.3 tetratricopeptide repeat protein [Tetrahymena thermophila SB210]|eukprot:XP_001022680.3 tetratricopeptide repeat protein [Tetrahymena thermophila SB210]